METGLSSRIRETYTIDPVFLHAPIHACSITHPTPQLWLCVSSIGWGTSAQKWKKLVDLSARELTIPKMRKLIAETRTPMVTQLWRPQDLHSGGLVSSLELFIQVIKSCGKAGLHESSRELYGDKVPRYHPQVGQILARSLDRATPG
jgi:hypothetical protein